VKKIIIGIIIGLIAGVGVHYIVKWTEKIDTNKIVIYLPYANDYFYSDGKTYKDASPNPDSNMPRDVDSKSPIPLNVSMDEQKLTIGVRNINPQTIYNVRLFLEMPNEFIVTKYKSWMQYTDKQYNIPLGNINSGVGHNALEPIFFKIDKIGKYNINYTVTGDNFGPLRGIITFYTY